MRNTEELIEAVRHETILYDINHPNYMQSKLKDKTWDDIAKKLGLRNGTIAKKIWLKLRNCHRDALRRQRKYLKTGATIIKHWKFQKQMEFLVPYMTNRTRDDNMNNDECSNFFENAYKASQEQCTLSKYDFANAENKNMEIENVETKREEEENIGNKGNDINEVEESVELASTSRSMSIQKKNKKHNNDTILNTSLICRDQEKVLKKMIEPAPNDYLYLFFMTMYNATKNMPSTSQHLVRNKIFQAVSQIEAGLLNINVSKKKHIHTQYLYQPSTCNNSPTFSISEYSDSSIFEDLRSNLSSCGNDSSDVEDLS